MADYRDQLPQLAGGLFLTDSGLETTLVFTEGMTLPHFASFVLLETEAGRARLRDYLKPHIEIAEQVGAGFILGSVTWRANPEWGRKLGYSLDSLAEANRRSIELCAQVRDEYRDHAIPMPISGCIGPRGEGYRIGRTMSVAEAAEYHRWQIQVFRETQADFVSAATMSYAAEAAGIALAAREASMLSVISFTLETDGRLPDGSTLAEAIEFVDTHSGSAPAYYMINCAHPAHFGDVLQSGDAWMRRIRGLRANASRRSHAELDACIELDAGNPHELAAELRSLHAALPHINVLGGCCGTDHRHLAAIAAASLEVSRD